MERSTPNREELTEPLRRMVDLLGRLLGETIEHHAGGDVFEIVESLRTEAIERGPGAELRDEISALSLPEIIGVLHSFGAYFHLANTAEQVEITRINEEREHRATSDHPRTESVADAVEQLQQSGWSRRDFADLLAKLRIEPTLTAHPTEARRETLLDIQTRIARLLTEGVIDQKDFPARRLKSSSAARSH